MRKAVKNENSCMEHEHAAIDGDCTIGTWNEHVKGRTRDSHHVAREDPPAPATGHGNKDPLARLPVGWERMRHRGLLPEPQAKLTRPQMIIMIRERVEQRRSGWTTETANQNQQSAIDTDEKSPNTRKRATQYGSARPQAWHMA